MNESCHYLGIKKGKKRKDYFVTLQYFLNNRIYPEFTPPPKKKPWNSKGYNEEM